MAINEREGLFSPCSEWIWLCGAPECNCYGQFQRSFRPAQAQGRVKLHISAEGQYAAFVNGQYISSAQYADFPDYKAVQTPRISHRFSTEVRICWKSGSGIPAGTARSAAVSPRGFGLKSGRGMCFYAAAAEAAGQGSFRAICRERWKTSLRSWE